MHALEDYLRPKQPTEKKTSENYLTSCAQKSLMGVQELYYNDVRSSEGMSVTKLAIVLQVHSKITNTNFAALGSIWSHWVDWWLLGSSSRDWDCGTQVVPFLWICGITHRPWIFFRGDDSGIWGVCVRSCPATHTDTPKPQNLRWITEHLSKWEITEITQKTHLKSFRRYLTVFKVPLALPERKLSFGDVALLMN